MILYREYCRAFVRLHPPKTCTDRMAAAHYLIVVGGGCTFAPP